MWSLFNELTGLVLRHFTVALAAAAAAVLSAFATYSRSQLRDAIAWTLQPLTARFPWNSERSSERVHVHSSLASELTIIEISLRTSDGAEAVYRKTSDYAVTGDVVYSFTEALTTVGRADSFHCSFGLIITTVQEHGFFLSTIDPGTVLHRGDRFTNVFSAKLHNSFMTAHEHWTHEVARPTKYLVLRVHFPPSRPPSLVKCMLLEGMTTKQVATEAQIMEQRSGAKTVVWNVSRPQFQAVYKLEWVW